MEEFVHLHVHTEYSLLDGAGRIKDLVRLAREQGMKALAITDHGVMYGVVDFYKAARAEGIRPIIGCEVYTSPRRRFDKEPRRDDFQYHLTLLARNNEGYVNLMGLVTRGFTEGFYYKPRVDFELLEEYGENLIALSGCLAGEIPQLYLQGREKEAAECAARYRSLFGREGFYLELQDHNLPEQKGVNNFLVRLARELDIPLVATNDVHYLRREDAEVHDVLLCIQTRKTVEEENRLKFRSEEFYFKSSEEMARIFKDFPEALANTARIAEMCRVELDFSRTLLPQYEVPAGYTPAEYLRSICEKGLRQKYAEVTPRIQERLDYELGVIDQMGYNSYFLIVWDFVRFAYENGILVGPGRGSAAGSLVAYALSITNIDPLRYGLLFERFLNPERVTMPDIDIDFCYEKREKVIQYVLEKYGQDRVAQIITFGTMAARAAVRDVGRALNFPYGEVDRIAKLIPFEMGMTIEKALVQNPELKEMREKDARYRRLLDLSQAVEGMPRHASTHAAGVVISREPLVNYVPLQRTQEGINVTQFPMATLDELGLLKMDFLGLRTLTIMGETRENIKRRGGKELDLSRISLEDQRTFELLSRGDTAGVFQLESSGMRSVLKELKPNKFEDIIAVVALYRPGPMEQIPVFIKNKHSRRPIQYLHPDLEKILNETYGIMVYQEQIMEVAAKMAGFSLGQADLLRRAIGKKKKKILDEQRALFINGCLKKGHDEKVAAELYDLILKFASYGFNKSHAAAYALIAYQTAYLKANYPLEFMAALLTGAMASSEKVAFYISDCRARGIKVLAPDINESYLNFTVVGDNIRFGLAAVKNVGLGAIESILKAREAQGPFRSLRDFCNRVDLRACNRKVLESLIKSGAFDSLGGNRARLLAVLEETLSRAQTFQKERDNGQLSVFSLLGENRAEVADNLPDIPEYSPKEKLALEKEVLGFYISGHPLEQYKGVLELIPGLCRCGELMEKSEQKQVTAGGLVEEVRTIYTKKGRPMAFISLQDLTGSVEVVVFSDLYAQYRQYMVEDQLLIVKGRMDVKEEEGVKILCERIIPLPREPKQLFLKIGTHCDTGILLTLKELLQGAKGGVPVYLYFEEKKKILLVEEDCWVEDTSELRERLVQLLGKENVKIEELNLTG